MFQGIMESCRPGVWGRGENVTILHLTVKKKWFDLIASGDKKIEYREFKSYWEGETHGGKAVYPGRF